MGGKALLQQRFVCWFFLATRAHRALGRGRARREPPQQLTPEEFVFAVPGPGPWRP